MFFPNEIRRQESARYLRRILQTTTAAQQLGFMKQMMMTTMKWHCRVIWHECRRVQLFKRRVPLRHRRLKHRSKYYCGSTSLVKCGRIGVMFASSIVMTSSQLVDSNPGFWFILDFRWYSVPLRKNQYNVLDRTLHFFGDRNGIPRF